MMKRFLTMFTIGMFAVGLSANSDDTLARAVGLEISGKLEEAFLACLDIPGMEHAAVRLGRADPRRYLALCSVPPEEDRSVATWLVIGDLLLAAGEDGEALEAYRQAARRIANDGAVHEHYPVDRPGRSVLSHRSFRYSPRHPLLPFQTGPGSHRDNWLIRRFIALNAPEDAAGEYARIWELHRFRTLPYVVEPDAAAAPGRLPPSPATGPQRILPGGFDRYGLQFALDYAFFLRREGQRDKSLDVLVEAMTAMDLDRNPNPPAWGLPRGTILTPEEAEGYPRRTVATWGVHSFQIPVGLSRKEFLRLAFGAFKETVGTDALLDRLHAAANSDGRDAREAARIRRLTGRIRLLAGDPAGMLEAELAYIHSPEAGFSAWAKACRSGLIHEELGRPAEAAAAYEKALGLPAAPDELPDADEDVEQGLRRFSIPFPPHEAPDPRVSVDVTESLFRLYAALGEQEKLLELSLRQFEDRPQRLADPAHVSLARNRFLAAGRSGVFAEWSHRRIAELQAGGASPEADQALLGLALATDDLPLAAAKAAALVSRENSVEAGKHWAHEFRNRGGEAFQLYVKALQECAVTDPWLQWMLHDWTGAWEDSAETMVLLSGLLEREDARNHHFFSRTSRVHNDFDIAYRLMRGYQKQKDGARLQALGLRLARGEKPFGEWWTRDARRYDSRNHNDWPEDLNGALALLIHSADAATLETLSGLWREFPDFPAKRQLARRLREDGQAPPGPDFGWSGLAEGVRLIASNENVLSVAVSGDAVYAGMPWGVAVYGTDGTPVTRIALGRAVLDILPHRGVLWCATPSGLLRVDPQSGEIQELPTDADLETPDPARTDFQRGVRRLAADGDSVWIGTRHNIQRYDTQTNTLRVFPPASLGLESSRTWDRFFVTEPYVWAEGNGMLVRYDRASQSWSRPPQIVEGSPPVGLIGFFEGQLWGNVWVSDQLRFRPCRIDPHTLAVTPVLIDDADSPGRDIMSEPFALHGVWNGAPVFLRGGSMYYYHDEESETLREVPRDANGRLPGVTSLVPERLRLDEQTLVFGNRTRYVPPNQLMSFEDWPDSNETGERVGGLYLLTTDPDKQERSVRRISQTDTADSILHDHVFHFLPPLDGQPGWLSTGRGVARLTEDFRVAATYTRADGLSSNRVLEAVRSGPDTYFAAGWGGLGGGLLHYTPDTRVFTSFVQSDGLATDKLAGLEEAGGGIRLIYDFERHPHPRFRNWPEGGRQHRRFPPAEFDPETGTVRGNGEPIYADHSRVEGFADSLIQTRRDRRPAPFLGGFILSEHHVEGKRVLCTTRGVVVMPEDAVVADVEQMVPRVEPDPTLAMIQEAEDTPITQLTAEDVLLSAGNAHPRAKRDFAARTLAAAGPDIIPVLRRALTSGDRVVRSNAARAAGHLGDPALVPDLIAALGLESGLSRASIVWALGRLRAAEAVPELTLLYQEAMADHARRAGSGHRHAQQIVVAQSQFASIASMEDIAADMNELTRASLPRPVDPRENEELLEPRHILDAMAQMGSGRTREFYRTLAAGADTESRSQAAIHLAVCAPEDRDLHQSILRPLLGDTVFDVRLHAAASLIALGGDTTAAETLLLEALNSESEREAYPALLQLSRLRGFNPFGSLHPDRRGSPDFLLPFIPRLRELAAETPGSRHSANTREKAQQILRSIDR